MPEIDQLEAVTIADPFAVAIWASAILMIGCYILAMGSFNSDMGVQSCSNAFYLIESFTFK